MTVCFCYLSCFLCYFDICHWGGGRFVHCSPLLMARKRANLKYPSVTFNHYQLNLAVIISIVVSVKILPVVYLMFLELV